MLIPHGLTPEEIRVLQEFRRTQQKTMTIEEIGAIKHPVAGRNPVPALIQKGYLTESEPGVAVTLTARADEFLSYDPKP